jgi:hypothetical protein
VRLLALIALLLLAGCSGQSSQVVLYTPVADSCAKVSAWTWNSAGASFICFDGNAKPIGMVSGTAQSPLDLVSGTTNAAIIAGGAAVAAALIAR